MGSVEVLLQVEISILCTHVSLAAREDLSEGNLC